MNTRKRTIGSVIGNNEEGISVIEASSIVDTQPKRRRGNESDFLSRMTVDTKRRQTNFLIPSSTSTDMENKRRSSVFNKPQTSLIRPVPVTPAVSCTECGIKLKNQASLNTHRNVVHGELVRAKIMCSEDNCGIKFATMQSFIPHLNDIHGYDLKFTHKVFRYDPDFEFWLENLTTDGSVGFVKSSSTSNDGVYYYCKKSGKRDDDTGYCPAYFKVTKRNGKTDVYGQLEHVGHEAVPRFTEVSSQNLVAEKMGFLREKLLHLEDLLKSKINVDFPFESNVVANSLITSMDLADYHISEAIKNAEIIIPDMPKKRGRKKKEEHTVSEINFNDEDEPTQIEQEVEEARFIPEMLSDGKVQCIACGVTFKSLVSYNAHRNKVHRLAAYNP